MGSGGYSFESRSTRSATLGYDTKPREEIFSKRMSPLMDPAKAQLRESRDSEEHPESLAIIINLDETGSMGSIPHGLIKKGLPEMVNKIMKAGIADPQILFTGIGDHLYDQSPFQVGQFESSDELLDKWLTTVWLEGQGGGNGGESYSLAHYFAGYRTVTDCFEKRGQKGFLFTIGDEANHKTYYKESMESIFGQGEYGNYTSDELLRKAEETYHVFHLNVGHNSAYVDKSWNSLLGERHIHVSNPDDIPDVIAKIIAQNVSLFKEQNAFIEEKSPMGVKVNKPSAQPEAEFNPMNI